MKLSMAINYSGGFKEAAQRVVELEKAGLDVVWIAEAYSFDAISQVGYLAAITDRVEIGTGIVNVYSRTPALMAMTAAGCDYVSDGRFILGLGASGPQVVEGFHGVPYEKPMVRIREYIEACRMIWKREEKFEYHGQTFEVPLPAGEGTGLGKPLKIINHPVRSDIPIWWASLMGLSVTATAQHADGWLPIGGRGVREARRSGATAGGARCIGRCDVAEGWNEVGNRPIDSLPPSSIPVVLGPEVDRSWRSNVAIDSVGNSPSTVAGSNQNFVAGDTIQWHPVRSRREIRCLQIDRLCGDSIGADVRVHPRSQNTRGRHNHASTTAERGVPCHSLPT